MKVSIVVPSKGCKYLVTCLLVLTIRLRNLMRWFLRLRSATQEVEDLCRKASLRRDRTTARILHSCIKPSNESATGNLLSLYKSSILINSWILA
jgi:hypothetical protein